MKLLLVCLTALSVLVLAACGDHDVVRLAPDSGVMDAAVDAADPG